MVPHAERVGQLTRFSRVFRLALTTRRTGVGLHDKARRPTRGLGALTHGRLVHERMTYRPPIGLFIARFLKVLVRPR